MAGFTNAKYFFLCLFTPTAFFCLFPGFVWCQVEYHSKLDSISTNQPSLLGAYFDDVTKGQHHQLLHHRRRNIRHLHHQHRRHAEDANSTNGQPADHSDDSNSPPPFPKQSALLQRKNVHERDTSSEVKSASFPFESDFPHEYWVRIAQAKVLALAVENGTLPKADDYSELMKPAGCSIEHDKDCHEFTTKCAEDKANKILERYSLKGEHPVKEKVVSYMKTILSDCGLTVGNPEDFSEPTLVPPPSTIPHPVPVFHCNSHFSHNEVLTNFRMEYYPEKTWPYLTSLPSPFANLDKDLIPRYFVIEMDQQGKWSLPQKSVQSYWLFRFKTQPQQSYKIRVTAVSPKYVYPPVTSSLLTIYKSADMTVNKPRNLTVVNISVDDSAARPSPSALLKWQSGSGFNASCDYNVYYMHDDMNIVERKKGDDAFWVKLGGLHFHTNYTIRVFEKFGGGREANVSSELYIPSCLAMRRYSFDLCPPPKPTNVKLENATDQTFWVTWTPPKYVNASNRIRHYNISVDWIYTPNPPSAPTVILPDGLPHGSPPSAVTVARATSNSETHYRAPPQPLTSHRLFGKIISGNQTSILIKDVTKLRGQFKVTLTAMSAAGSSPEAVEFVYFEGSPLSDWTLQRILTLVLALFGVVALISLFCGLKHFHERRQRQKKRQQKFEDYERETLSLQHVADRDATKWDIQWCNLDLREAIGQGNFGLVRRAILNENGKRMVVAVKTLRDGVDSKEEDKLWEEYEILKNLDPHPHVVSLKGIVTKHVAFPLLVVEYCDGGDLQTHLRKAVKFAGFSGQRRYSPANSSACSSHGSSLSGGSSHSSITNLNGVSAPSTGSSSRIVTNAAYFLKNEVDSHSTGGGPPGTPPPPPITIADLLSYARQIACGMEYLSGNKIVHRDLAARNILLSGKNRILKISDFGLSRDVYEQNLYKKKSKGEIPIKWLAVESILNEFYTTKSDVWSYGILLWEIFTYGGNPYPGVENIDIFKLLKEGYRMTRPDTCPKELYELMRICWEEDPAERPDFTAIRLILEEIIEKTTHVTYLNLDNSSVRGANTPLSGVHCYKNCDSGFEEGFEGAGNEPVLPPRNKKRANV